MQWQTSFKNKFRLNQGQNNKVKKVPRQKLRWKSARQNRRKLLKKKTAVHHSFSDTYKTHADVKSAAKTQENQEFETQEAKPAAPPWSRSLLQNCIHTESNSKKPGQEANIRCGEESSRVRLSPFSLHTVVWSIAYIRKYWLVRLWIYVMILALALLTWDTSSFILACLSLAEGITVCIIWWLLLINTHSWM